jgi:hypothetical protein
MAGIGLFVKIRHATQEEFGMNGERLEYEGHQIELRESEGRPELLIDDVPLRYGQLPNGEYFLNEYAYDWTGDLMDLARRFIDHRRRADRIRRERVPEEGRQ